MTEDQLIGLYNGVAIGGISFDSFKASVESIEYHNADREGTLLDLARKLELAAGNMRKAVEDCRVAPAADSQDERATGLQDECGALPSVCDGKEQDEFEAWAAKDKFDMTCHPLHWLFLNERTDAARQGWKAALEYVNRAASTSANVAQDDSDARYTMDQMRDYALAFHEARKTGAQTGVCTKCPKWMFDERCCGDRALPANVAQGAEAVRYKLVVQTRDGLTGAKMVESRDGAWVKYAAPPAQTADMARGADAIFQSRVAGFKAAWRDVSKQCYEDVSRLSSYDARIVYTAPPALTGDPITMLLAKHAKELENNEYAYFELAYTRRTEWMAWICSNHRDDDPNRKVIARGQGSTPQEACDAALTAAQSASGEPAASTATAPHAAVGDEPQGYCRARANGEDCNCASACARWTVGGVKGETE